ncbi:hypothetical protein LV89_00893 [Arcicella aurantiaca]|uniref:Uncharacterized protein n=1 Tax=Arcicella aurantiaca TaxID=591202 RepID=A0A316EG15_9BACT|nr:hypothetical protein [Arcicella aurantiaca]PWK28687.1 hypothetical protein LV89_00893 [Arcicella aurantiaca]
MKKYMVAVMIVISTISSAIAQYGNQGYGYDDDRYYYDNEFDWHWDIRVRISDGIQRGQITRNESNILYRRLEDLERKEYAYQSDGIFTSWEQQEIWDDVVYLNRRVGIELYDNDRSFYGFDVYGYDRRGYPRWYYQGGFDFFRFDKRGFGSITLGYVPRPNYNGWYRNERNQVARRYYSERSQYNNRNNQRGGYERADRDNRGNSRNGGAYDNNRERANRVEPNRGDNNNGGYSQGRGNDRIEPNRGDNNGGGYSQGRGNDRVEPNRGDNNNGGYSQGRGGDRANRTEPSNNGRNSNGRSEPPRGNNGGGDRPAESRGGRN